jgi:hypothetical protein
LAAQPHGASTRQGVNSFGERSLDRGVHLATIDLLMFRER